MTQMTRTVTAHVTCQVNQPAEMVWSVAAAHGPVTSDEDLTMTSNGEPLVYDEIAADEGTRLHVVRGVPAGPFELTYKAVVEGHGPEAGFSTLHDIVYRRPSRYCDSDTLAAVATAEFGALEGKELVDAVSSWVGVQLAYVSGSSRPTDGAVQTFLQRQGVCRDFAHLVIALLRARNMPARLVSVYAPGLDPMDFHAVAEAYVDGAWHVVDATSLAPRQTMLRIATGADASDTAFLTVHSGLVELGMVEVTAVVDPELPADDATRLVRLS